MEYVNSYMFEFSVSKDMAKKYNNDKRRILTYLLACLLTLIVKELKISVEQSRMVTTLNIINTQNIIFSVVGTHEPYPSKAPLQLCGFLPIHIRIWSVSSLHGNSPL